MYEIKTNNYVKAKKILVDGNEWTMVAPGAGSELALSQAQRRAKLLDTKIEAGTAVESDYDLYDALEKKMMDIFKAIFKDGTQGNSQVNAWLESTPMAVIYAIMEDIKKQAEENGGSVS
jgi:hypothetical protein